MSEYLKDETTSKGWRQVPYGKNRKERDDGAPVTADGMDEGADDGSDGDEAPDQAEFLLQ